MARKLHDGTFYSVEMQICCRYGEPHDVTHLCRERRVDRCTVLATMASAPERADQRGAFSHASPHLRVLVDEKRSGAGYDYNSLLGMSWLFYEAQRSGKLPRN